MVGVLISGIIILLIVAVHDLIATACRITKDRLRGFCLRAAGAYPAVLHIAYARFGDTGTCERAHDAEVIDITAKMIEQRVVQSADVITVTMQVTFEALALVVGDGRPVGIAGHFDIGMHDDVEVSARLDLIVEQGVTGKVASDDLTVGVNIFG